MSEATTPLAHYADLNLQTIDPTTYGDSDFEYVDLSAVKAGVLHSAATERHTFASAPSRARRLVEPGDFLFGTVRPQLRSHAWPGRSCVASTGFTVVRAKRGVADIRFLGHFLLSDEAARQVAALEVGSSYPAVNERDVGRLRLPHVSLEEQRRIAEVLDTIDDTIQATERVIAKLTTARMAILDELVAKIEDSSAQTFSEALTDPLCYGIVQVGGHVPNGVPVVAIRDLEGDFAADLHRTSEAIDAKYPRSRVTGGEVLLSIKGTIGRVGLVPTEFTGNISRDVALLRTTSDLRGDFLMWFLRSAEGQRRLRHISVGTTRAELSLHALRRVRVPVPSLAVQEDVVTAVDHASTRLRSERGHLRTLRETRKGLAADLLSSRVRVVAA